jgi:hypothetical protein
MKPILVVLGILIVVVGLWLFLRPRRSLSVADPTPSKKPAADAGRDLRALMLQTTPSEFGLSSSAEFPRVYGVCMDWPIGGDTATIFASATGDASLYTTSTFGIIGGIGHETVTRAAKAFVQELDPFYDEATPAKEFPYPDSNRVYFYLLTFSGVRVLASDLSSIEEGSSRFAPLFGRGQDVLTQLRIVTESR